MSEQLKAVKLSEERWIEWSLLFDQVADLLGLCDYVFENKPQPVTQQILVEKLCNGDQAVYAEEIAPGLQLDIFGTAIFHISIPELLNVEIMAQSEYLRFKAMMTLLASVFMTCLSKDSDLMNIADKNGARRKQDVALMFRNIKDHLLK